MSILQDTPRVKEKKRTFQHKENSTSQKQNKLLHNNIPRFSENFAFKKDGMDLEKSVRKLKQNDLFFPGQNSPSRKKNTFQSPEKGKKENSFNARILESEKLPSSKYLILNCEDEDKKTMVSKIIKKLIFHILNQEKNLIHEFILKFNQRNSEIFNLFVTFNSFVSF